MVVGMPARSEVGSARLGRERPLSVAEYLRLIDSGVLPEDPSYFLWMGRLVTKVPKDWPHVKSLSKLSLLAVRTVPEGVFVQQEQPMVLRESVPEPDLAIYRGSIEDYDRDRRPSASDAALVVEVADTRLEEDRGEVLEAYAAHGIRIYWIVNLRDGIVEVHSDPLPGESRYATFSAFGPDDSVPLLLDGREVARFTVRDFLP